MKHAIAEKERMPIQKNQFINNLFVAEKGRYYKLRPEDILWITSDGNYVHINTNHKEFTNRISLTNLIKKLPENKFFKVHKCFIVRLDAIDHIDRTNSELWVGEKCIPIGRSYKANLLGELNLIG